MIRTGHRGTIGQALLMALVAVSMLFAVSGAIADASPVLPAAHVAHDLASDSGDTSRPADAPAHETGCAAQAHCSSAVAMLAPVARALHTRAMAAPLPLVLLRPGGLSAAPHAKPPIV